MTDAHSDNPGHSASRAKLRIGVIWLALLVVLSVLYGLTADRGAQWADSGIHIHRILAGDMVNELGLALSHPLHFYLGRLLVAAGWGEPSIAVTWVSVLAGALAVANLFGAITFLTARRSAGLFAAVALAFAHTYWRMSTITETYTLVAALLTAEIWCVALFARSRKPAWLVLAFLANGLGVSNHMLAALTAPLLVIVLLMSRSRKRDKPSDSVNPRLPAPAILWCAAAWVLGAGLYLVLILKSWQQTGDAAGTLQSALFGKDFAREVLNPAPALRVIAIALAFLLYNFPNAVLPLAVCGLAGMRRLALSTLLRVYLVGALIIHALFALRYEVVDQHTFLVPTLVLCCVWGGIGFACIHRQSPGARQTQAPVRRRKRGILPTVCVGTVLLTPLVYAVAPAVFRHYEVLRGVAREKPYRDDYVYVFSPWSVVENSAEQMASAAARLAGEDGLVIFEDGMAEHAIRYRLRRLGKTDVQVVAASRADLDALAQDPNRTIVLVPANADKPRLAPPTGTWQREGDLYVLNRTTTNPNNP